MTHPFTADSYRLPRAVVPIRYDIRLEPDLPASNFAGEETVTVTVSEPVTEIVLNCAELQIQEVSVQGVYGVTLKGEVRLDEAAERARLSFPEPLIAGTWRLSLRFTGILNNRLHGFYRSSYKDADGVQRLLAATQFEATDARRAFPCWDEPDRKAVFAITLVVDERLAVVSNTAPVSERPMPGTGKKAVTFADTIKMSTYLVAFVGGELEATEPVMVGGTLLRIWCVPGKGRLAGFAQEIAAFSLSFFERYYGLPYPGDKLDLLAIPDFAAGAMENLGAITFRETALLVDEGAASHAELERVADVVAHEIAHMWFGDLVTMAWWNGLWLNEAFATFMEMLAVDAWKPAWERWVAFGVSRAAALAVDGLQSSRPIEFEVRAPRDADAMFDVLTYEKGAAVLRMIEQYLGPEVFRDGVRAYLREHEYGNAETTDLWKALGEAAGRPIPSVMDGWIFRPGYPVVTVESDEEGKCLVLSQRRFTYLPEAAGDAEPWRIPVTLRVGVRGGVVTRTLLLDGPEARATVPGRVDWAIVNAGGHGFYRVRYAPDLLRKLTRKLNSLTPIDRFNLVNDAWAATLAGLVPVADYLDLTERFRNERDKNVWTVLTGSFEYLNRVIEPEERPALEALVRDRLGPAVEQLDWSREPDESELMGQLRGDLLRGMGALGNDAAIQAKALAFYSRYRDDPSAVDPDVVPALVAILAYVGGEGEYADFFQAFKAARTPQEEQRYLYSLAGFRRPELIERTLQRTINGEVRAQDAPFLVRSLLMSVYARELAWRFVRENWETMERQYPPKSGLRRMCEGITALATPELEADAQEFFRSRNITLGGKTLEQYLERLHVAVVFREREAANLAAYLSRQRR
jgi:puromycin-sensitive aminopeptidase